jgi:sarcosine oxidase subunit gamma
VTAELARSPLAHRAADLDAIGDATRGGLSATEIPFLAQLDLRVDPAVARERAMLLPFEPNTVRRHGARAALWLGPDEWLVVGPPGSTPSIVAELEGALAGIHRSLVDVSASRAVLDLSGPLAREVLSRGCGLDLHPSRWVTGMCAQTLLGKVAVLLEQLAEPTTRVFLRPSFADHLVDWLAAAARVAVGH